VPINNLPWNRARYTLLAPFYDLVAGFGPQRRRAVELLAPRPGERVLIDGCGTGADLGYLPSGLEITATDLTPAMVERTRGRAWSLKMPVTVQVADAQDLPFENDSFDVVLLHLILAVVPDPEEAIYEVERVLRPGGRVSVLDKWMPPGQKPSLARRAANLVTNAIATDITRSLEPLLATSGLMLEHRESTGPGGFFSIAILRKP
jgi:phosphatidylethanolamine/phosphatidyl-N-methylethanolamine N-methyltransferase